MERTKLRRKKHISFLVMVLIIALLFDDSSMVYAGGSGTEDQTEEEMESFTQANRTEYPGFGIGRFNTYAIFRVYGSNGAAYSSDLFNSITASDGIISPYYPYIMNNSIEDGQEVSSYVYDAEGNKQRSTEPWYYIGSLIPDAYSELFDIDIEENGQISFSPKTFTKCTDAAYSGDRYIAYDNTIGKIADENLDSTKKSLYSKPYPACSCDNICGYVASGGSTMLSLSGYYDWNALLCSQYKNHVKDGYDWVKIKWNSASVSTALQEHYENYKHKFVLVDRRDWRWSYTASDGGRMTILYSNWWVEGGISFTRDADARYRALNEYIISTYGEKYHYKNYYILSDFVTVLWDSSGIDSGKQLEYKKYNIYGVRKIYRSIADVKENLGGDNFVQYMADREVPGWTIRIGENAGAAITVNIHLVNAATGKEISATSLGLDDESIMPGSTINKSTILDNQDVAAAAYGLAGSDYENVIYGNRMTAINTATDQAATDLDAGDYKISSGINSYTTVDVYYSCSVRPTNTPTPKPTNTNTPRPTNTNTPRPTNTNTPSPTNSNTPRPTNTNTPRPTYTITPGPTNTAAPSPTPEITITDIKVNNSGQVAYDESGNPVMKQGNKLDFFAYLNPYTTITEIKALPHYYYDDGSDVVTARLLTTVSGTEGIVTFREAGVDYSDLLNGTLKANGSGFTYVFPYSAYVIADSDYTEYLKYKQNNTISGQEPFFKKDGSLLIIYDFHVVTSRQTLYYYRAFTVRVNLSNGSTWIH